MAVPTLEKMGAWVAQGHAVTSAPSPMSDPRAILTTPPKSRRPAVRERALCFGEGRRLFGIVTEPVDRALFPGRPAFALLNEGANDRVPPNRMDRAAPRALAALGY